MAQKRCLSLSMNIGRIPFHLFTATSLISGLITTARRRDVNWVFSVIFFICVCALMLESGQITVGFFRVLLGRGGRGVTEDIRRSYSSFWWKTLVWDNLVPGSIGK